MLALYIILGIILFFVIILSIPVFADFEYTDALRFSVSWLFLKFKIYPRPDKPKKPKKEKPKKEKKPDEKKSDELEVPKEKKENFIKTFYNNQGVSGVIELISNCASALGKMSKGFIRSIRVRDLDIKVGVTESDAAQTAIKYGKICQKLYPPLGFICSTMNVKDYKVNIYADYCGEKTFAEVKAKVGIVPRKLINACIAMAVRLVIQLLKVIISNKKAEKNNQTKGGQEQ